MDLRQRLKVALSYKDMRLVDLANQLGMSDAYLAVMIKRQAPRPRWLAIAQHLGVDPGWLIDGMPSLAPAWYTPGTSPATALMKRAQDTGGAYNPVDPLCIPLVATAGAASDRHRGIALDPPELIRLRDDLAMVKVYGDSAAPVALDGQFALVADREPAPDDLALIDTPDGLVLKRWCPQPDKETIVLASPNGGRGSMTFPLASLGKRWQVVGIIYPEAIK